MGASGFRSSWESIPRNSSFRRSASRSFSFTSRSSSSAPFRAVMSWTASSPTSGAPDARMMTPE